MPPKKDLSSKSFTIEWVAAFAASVTTKGDTISIDHRKMASLLTVEGNGPTHSALEHQTREIKARVKGFGHSSSTASESGTPAEKKNRKKREYADDDNTNQESPATKKAKTKIKEENAES
ncbi:MAG: hypothetical protein M1828_006331 [Chrysothrix sp. TS-e1954]|nr:MAG: hypothetical protein M1828_006331 [Chrysothrix sp. TS-e1954]